MTQPLNDIVPVRIRMNGAGVGSVEVAGTDVSHYVRRVSFDSRAGHLAEVDLEVIPRAVEVDIEARVRIDADTRAVLLALGWTPPGGRP